MSQGTMFTKFPELPVELQMQVWEHACLSTTPRIACLRVQAKPSARLSHEVLNLKNTDVELGWEILNPSYLRETDSLTSLLETCHLSRAITLQQIQLKGLDSPWLRRLGLSNSHIDPDTDIVFLGHPEDKGRINTSMAGLSLVLGRECPSIMVPAMLFDKHAVLNLEMGRINPVAGSLSALRAVGPTWNKVFRSGAGGPLLSPGLPESIYYYFPSPTDVLYCEHRSGSFCLHYEHLNIIPWDEISNESLRKSNWKPEHNAWLMQRAELVRYINIFWYIVKDSHGSECRTPNLFFVEAKE